MIFLPFSMILRPAFFYHTADSFTKSQLFREFFVIRLVFIHLLEKPFFIVMSTSSFLTTITYFKYLTTL